MLLRFTKMHELGNDFVVLDLLTQRFQLKPGHIRRLADRRLGVGCDHVLAVAPPDCADADFQYRLYSADGSEASPLGNGARCLARFVVDRQLTGSRRLTLQAPGGRLQTTLREDGLVELDLGPPSWTTSSPDHATVFALDRDWPFQLIQLAGVDHAVFVVDEPSLAATAGLGAILADYVSVSEGLRIVVAQPQADSQLLVHSYSADMDHAVPAAGDLCAAVAAGCRSGALTGPVHARHFNGQVQLHWPGADRPATLTGPAVTAFEGQLRL